MPELRAIGEPSICYLCGCEVSWTGAEIDHVVPLASGGQSVPSNLLWTHRRCNRVKHDLTLPELRQHLAKMLAQPW